MSGVVVHVGKAIGLTDQLATDYMKKAVREALVCASSACPLLIETPAGCGSEILCTAEELADFYLSFSVQERTRLGLCVDTCHVWAAGYLPLDYLIRLEELVGSVAIKLVHFNDSKDLRGSRTDNHHYYREPGGMIGLDQLAMVAEWCGARSIDMVTE